MSKAQYEQAKEQFPGIAELTTGEWLKFLEGPAGLTMLGRLLGDVFNAIKDEDERRTGQKQKGRRPPRFASLEVVVSTVFPGCRPRDAECPLCSTRAALPFPTVEIVDVPDGDYGSVSFIEAMDSLLNGKSQREFVKDSDLTQITISRLMRGEYKPDMPVMERIAEIAGVSPGYFAAYRAQYAAELVRLVLEERPQLSAAVLQGLLNLRGEST